ncbi:MAG: hypothetical protein V3R16_02575 [Nitrospirales bacterium]
MRGAWKPRYPAKIDPTLAIEELERIRLTNGSMAKPQQVVNVARAEDSPLHDQFEWNDTLAAEQHRLHQARTMLRSILIVVEGEGEELLEPYYVHVEVLGSQEHKQSGYVPLRVAMADPDMRAQVLGNALRELEVFRRKYGQLIELKIVMEAIVRLTPEE